MDMGKQASTARQGLRVAPEWLAALLIDNGIRHTYVDVFRVCPRQDGKNHCAEMQLLAPAIHTGCVTTAERLSQLLSSSLSTRQLHLVLHQKTYLGDDVSSLR